MQANARNSPALCNQHAFEWPVNAPTCKQDWAADIAPVQQSSSEASGARIQQTTKQEASHHDTTCMLVRCLIMQMALVDNNQQDCWQRE